MPVQVTLGVGVGLVEVQLVDQVDELGEYRRVVNAEVGAVHDAKPFNSAR